jgi:hypothetical protein
MRRILATAALLTAVSAGGPALADQAYKSCLSRVEQRAAIAKGQAVPLATAVRSIRATLGTRGAAKSRSGREVLQARLCRGPNGLVYVLTVLTRDGKVSRATVDAGSGRVVEAR